MDVNTGIPMSFPARRLPLPASAEGQVTNHPGGGRRSEPNHRGRLWRSGPNSGRIGSCQSPPKSPPGHESLVLLLAGAGPSDVLRPEVPSAPSRRGGRACPQRDRLLVRGGFSRPADVQSRNLRHVRDDGGPQNAALRHPGHGHQPEQRPDRGRPDQRPGPVRRRSDHRPVLCRGFPDRHGRPRHGPGAGSRS